MSKVLELRILFNTVRGKTVGDVISISLYGSMSGGATYLSYYNRREIFEVLDVSEKGVT